MTLKSNQAQAHPEAEPLYDVDRWSGASIEVFYSDASLARSFGARGPGWFWWTCKPGALPQPPAGPFATSYVAFRQAIAGDEPRCPFGMRPRR
jgi:hypothetical protein